jgi:hypothetical protein
MTTYKTSELGGVLLDYAVSLCEKGQFEYARTLTNPARIIGVGIREGRTGRTYSPSTVWLDGGPIIERERIALIAGSEVQPGHNCWTAKMPGPHGYYPEEGSVIAFEGPLVAAMRAYVASKLGETVELP